VKGVVSLLGTYEDRRGALCDPGVDSLRSTVMQLVEAGESSQGWSRRQATYHANGFMAAARRAATVRRRGVAKDATVRSHCATWAP
jgi:hypothetical protein